MRDPFVLRLVAERQYVLFGTTDTTAWGGPATGFDCYLSVGESLDEWEGPIPAFRPPHDFWSRENYWAPEVHPWHRRFYMFASFKAPGVCRGTQILVADDPTGPYLPHSLVPVTPPDWECLDGTLFVDAGGDPWMVFCHEWLQTTDGEMCAVPLASDLSGAVGDPILLFRASEAPWAKPVAYRGITDGYITDGPFLHRISDGTLVMLWSTAGVHGYCMGLAVSESGEIDGPWRQQPEPLFATDGGHGMLFQAFDGTLYMTLHQPNKTPLERPFFLPVVERDGLLSLG